MIMLLTGRLHRPKASRSLPLPSSRPSTSPSSLVLTSASSHTLQVVAAPLPKATASLRSAARARAAAKRLANAKEACGALSTAQLLRQSSVAPTSLRAYETGVRGFETFALAHKWKLQSGSARGKPLLCHGQASLCQHDAIPRATGASLRRTLFHVLIHTFGFFCRT